MTYTTSFLIAVLFATVVSASFAVRVESGSAFAAEMKKSSKGGHGGSVGPGGGFGIPGFDVPGFGSGVPGFGSGVPIGGGYGAGYGGPSGGYAKGGIVRPTVVCSDAGPCYKKKLTCPAKCFTSYSHSGKNYGSGGGGGGCTMDCKKKCVAYC
ncbi:uncharacterized protein LOC143883836 [Tasmannia lanceolata]|uniref:uncharacterized protein LOC143883836 n=1 Tax=Tasmannia lanceolata TaxID=3420 RepID=UPI0040630BCD